jgi:serine/threonine protein kinase
MLPGSAHESTEAGKLIGPYRILSTLGRGGMGVVYEGVHSLTGEPVAVKTVRAPSARLLSSIRREIHALSRLRHPCVARIVGEGIHEGLPYYAMELYGGETLRSHLDVLYRGHKKDRSGATTLPEDTSSPTVPDAMREGSTALDGFEGEPPRRTMAEVLPALALVRSACAPLAYLHGEGVVHCDLKPSNIVLRADGSPVLVDLGVARSGGSGGRDELTAADVVAGSTGYMAPEQVRGDLLDPRADLYALGVILYEVLTGRRPFFGATHAIAVQQFAGPAAAPSTHNDAVPPALDALVLRLLDPACLRSRASWRRRSCARARRTRRRSPGRCATSSRRRPRTAPGITAIGCTSTSRPTSSTTSPSRGCTCRSRRSACTPRRAASPSPFPRSRPSRRAASRTVRGTPHTWLPSAARPIPSRTP